jgi:NAD(P)H dehydrogenase (quinone)
MTIAIIGATGKLGGHTIDALLDRGIGAADIVALGRNAERLAALAERGLRTSTSTTSPAPPRRSPARRSCS